MQLLQRELFDAILLAPQWAELVRIRLLGRLSDLSCHTASGSAFTLCWRSRKIWNAFCGRCAFDLFKLAMQPLRTLKKNHI